MNPPFRRKPPSPFDSAWADTLPARRGSFAAGQQKPTGPMPLDDLAKGVEVEELDSESLFARFFGQPEPPTFKRR